MRSFLVAALALALALVAPGPAHAESPADPPDPDADAIVNAAPAGEDRLLDTPAGRAEYERGHLAAVPGVKRAAARRGTELLTGVDLYLALGRPDLADDYRSGQWKRGLFVAAGAALVGIGVYLPFIPGEDCRGDLDVSLCEHTNDERLGYHVVMGTGSVLLGASFIVSAWLWIDPNPVSPAHLGGLVEHANWKLRRHLGVVDVAVTPSLAPGGGGLALSGRF